MNEESYEKRLQNSIDWAHRCSEGQFLLQHFLRISGIYSISGTVDGALINEGKRQVGIEFMEQVRRNRIGPAILKTAVCNVIDIDEEPESAEEIYDPLDADLSQHTR